MRALPETNWYVYDEYGCIVSLSKYDQNDKCCSKGITDLSDLKLKFVQRRMVDLLRVVSTLEQVLIL